MNARLVKYLASAGGCILSFKCICNFEEINKRYRKRERPGKRDKE